MMARENLLRKGPPIVIVNVIVIVIVIAILIVFMKLKGCAAESGRWQSKAGWGWSSNFSTLAEL